MQRSRTSACTKVFDIAELREMILLHGTPKELLLWQRVNTQFQATMANNRFREKLCLEAKIYDQSMGPRDQVLTWHPMIEQNWKITLKRWYIRPHRRISLGYFTHRTPSSLSAQRHPGEPWSLALLQSHLLISISCL